MTSDLKMDPPTVRCPSYELVTETVPQRDPQPEAKPQESAPANRMSRKFRGKWGFAILVSAFLCGAAGGEDHIGPTAMPAEQTAVEEQRPEAAAKNAGRELLFSEFEAAVQQKQPEKLLVLVPGGNDRHVLLFRYDAELAVSIGWLLYARNQLMKYDRLIPAAIEAAKTNDRAKVLSLYYGGLRDQELAYDRFREQIPALAEKISRLAQENELLVSRFAVPSDGRIRTKLTKGKYIIVYFPLTDLGCGYIFEKEENSPIFLEAAQERWFDRSFTRPFATPALPAKKRKRQ